LTVAQNFLIVEDNAQWCDEYVRAATREGFETIKIAKNLPEAEGLIDDMQFAVAFVDIGLNEKDDQNIDGLRVMDRIRRRDDKTSIVVVTGRSGRDVLPITRDAIVKYGAHEIVGKTDIEPQDIRRLLKSGLEAFQGSMSTTGKTARQALRGDLRSWEWDDQMLKAIQVESGVQGLYDFLDELIVEFVPLVDSKSSKGVSVDPETGIAHGDFWSRSVGRAIAICYGSQQQVANQIEMAKSQGTLLEGYEGVHSQGAVNGVRLRRVVGVARVFRRVRRGWRRVR
jgi:ActR/RegA family two-component response regulator